MKYEDVYGGGCFNVGGSFKGFDWIDEPVGSDDRSLPSKSKDEFSNEVILDDVVSSPATTLSLLLKRKGKSRVKFTRMRAIIKRSKMLSLRKSVRLNYGRFVTVIVLNEDVGDDDLKDDCSSTEMASMNNDSCVDVSSLGGLGSYPVSMAKEVGNHLDWPFYTLPGETSDEMYMEEEEVVFKIHTNGYFEYDPLSSIPFDTRFKRKISKSKKTGVIHDEGAGRKRKKSLVNRGNKGKEKVFEDEGADKKRMKTLVNGAMVNGKAKMVEVVGAVKTGRDRGVVIGGKEEVVSKRGVGSRKMHETSVKGRRLTWWSLNDGFVCLSTSILCSSTKAFGNIYLSKEQN
ncbi:hypothetical protein Tco_0299496 [Tanacetum coccineum]